MNPTAESSPHQWADAAARNSAEYQQLLAQDPPNHIAIGLRERGLAEIVPHLVQAVRDMETRVDTWHSSLIAAGEAVADVVARAERALAAGGDVDWRERYWELASSVGFVAANYCGVKGASFDRWYLGLGDFEDARDVASREWAVGGLPGADFTGIAIDDAVGAKRRAEGALQSRGYRVLRWETVADDTPWVLGPAQPDHYVAHVEPIEKG